MYRYTKLNALYSALLTLLVIFLSYLENELFYANGFNSSIEINCLRTIILLLCFAQAVLVFRYFQVALDIRVACWELHPASNDSFRSALECCGFTSEVFD